MATERHATPFINYNLFICIAISLAFPIVGEGATRIYDDVRNFANDEGRRLTREYDLRQGALRGLIVKPSRQYNLQLVEMFLGIPYAAPPTGNFRFMPPASAPPWPGVKMATHFAPVCPQAMPPIKKDNPPSMGRQNYLNRIRPFLANESEDCLYLNIYVPYREQKSKKFPVLVFIHGDSFEWSSGNPYDGRILASYGNIMVITINFRLGILGFLKPSLTEHDYGNNGLLDQLAALQWIKDNIEDLNGDPTSVTLMGHGTGAACVNYLMLSPISNNLFHRAILMSGSALSDWAITKDPMQYTFQVVQSLGCNPTAKNMMSCLQGKPLSEIKKVQIMARQFETPLGPTVAGSFVPSEPATTMQAFPNLLSKYQLLSGVTELESYHDFGVIELDHGILENQRDDFIIKYAKIVFEGAEQETLTALLKEYSPSKLHPQRWSVETNRDVILNLFSDARTLAPIIRFANYQAKANRQSYFYVFGHNSISCDFAALNKSVHGAELPYILGVPLGGATTHLPSEYTPQEKLLSEVVMRLWTNFVKNGSPNTQSINKYHTLDQKHWNQFNVEWPEYDIQHQPYLRLDIPPSISSLYRSNYTNFWLQVLPQKVSKYLIDPLIDYTPSTQRAKTTHKSNGIDIARKIWQRPQVTSAPHYIPSVFGKEKFKSSFSQPAKLDTDAIYRQIQSINMPSRSMPSGLLEKTTTTAKPSQNIHVKTSSATITLIISLGVLFLVVDVAICSILYFKKRKLRLREQTLESSRQSRAEIGEVDLIGQKSKDDKSALQTLKNSCSVIKSMSIKKKKSVKNIKKKPEVCKTPKSDDSGGFRERFQLRRHLSTSTLDAHTKVRDWIANEVMHRCAPTVLRQSNSEINNDKNISVAKPFTRSEELLSDTKRLHKDELKIDNTTPKGIASTSFKAKTSEKTTSTSAFGSHSSIKSQKNFMNSVKRTSKSTDSLKSKADSLKSKKVSVAIDATPAARTSAVLKQEPIELSKSFDSCDQKHSINRNAFKKPNTEGETKSADQLITKDSEKKTYTNSVTLSVSENKPLVISHKHSTSDPVSDVNYDKLYKEKMESGNPLIDILPPVTFRNDINVTSREDGLLGQPLSAEEALVTIKRRNFPKVLPDLPKAQKRLSLQPTALQSFRSYSNSTECQSDRSKVPPQPPPRTTTLERPPRISTLERRLAYKNTKLMSSFDNTSVRKIPEVQIKKYENINAFSPDTRIWNKSIESSKGSDRSDSSFVLLPKDREIPKVIIASSSPSLDQTIVIKPSSNQIEMPTNVPRVRLPDDFHLQMTSSVTSFSSFCSEDDDNDDLDEAFLDDLAEDKLIQELVGGVESPTNMTDVLDSKGPDNSFEKKLEIIPFKINPGIIVPKNVDDYVCVTDLHLPGVSALEPTAKIKPNFGLNKLQHRTESINRPPEKAIKVKPKKSMKPSILSSYTLKSKSSVKSKTDLSKLEHSTSGSSNDTETSTGTVKKVEVIKDNK